MKRLMRISVRCALAVLAGFLVRVIVLLPTAQEGAIERKYAVWDGSPQGICKAVEVQGVLKTCPSQQQKMKIYDVVWVSRSWKP